MRTQITLLTDYRDCEIGPNVDFCDVRPSGRTVFWREEDSSTIWMAFVPEEHYSEQDFVLESLQGERLPEEYHRLRYDETSQWTVVEGPLRENQYVKVWRLTGYTPGEEERFWPSNEVRGGGMLRKWGDLDGRLQTRYPVYTGPRGNHDTRAAEASTTSEYRQIPRRAGRERLRGRYSPGQARYRSSNGGVRAYQAIPCLDGRKGDEGCQRRA